MSNATLIHTRQQLLERVLICILTTVPCFVCLFINCALLFTLRSKPLFRDTSRYILLYNLLFADTALLVQNHLMYILAVCRITLTYPVCGVLTMLANLTTAICFLTLAVMSLERYVAVCYPLRHTTIITIRNTEVAIIVVWAFSALSILTRVTLLLNLQFEKLQSLQMKYFCGKESILLDPMLDLYDTSITYCLFGSTGVAVSCSYIGVIIAARSASTDKASARKAANTLLLHLVQLGLSFFSTIRNPILIAISQVLEGITLLYMQIFFYVYFNIFPRCLTSLIYGIRDQTIRPVLMYNLCCQCRGSLSVTL